MLKRDIYFHDYTTKYYSKVDATNFFKKTEMKVLVILKRILKKNFYHLFLL